MTISPALLQKAAILILLAPVGMFAVATELGWNAVPASTVHRLMIAAAVATIALMVILL